MNERNYPSPPPHSVTECIDISLQECSDETTRGLIIKRSRRSAAWPMTKGTAARELKELLGDRLSTMCPNFNIH